jgi:exodeoxyribonuclease VII small subunit
MSKPKSETPSYQAMKDELDDVIAQLQTEDLDIDKAVVLYERGQQLTAELQAYLKKAQNRVKVLKPRYGTTRK